VSHEDLHAWTFPDDMLRLDVEAYLNLPETRALLGIHHDTGVFNMMSRGVGQAFFGTLDFSHQTYYYVANLLERGVKVLNVSPTVKLRRLTPM